MPSKAKKSETYANKEKYVPILTYQKNILSDPESENEDNNNDTTDTKCVQKRKYKQASKLPSPTFNFELLVY